MGDAVQDHRATMPHPLRDLLGELGRCGDVLGPGDSEDGGLDLGQALADVEGPESLAGLRIAFGLGVLQNVQQRRRAFAVAFEESGREPAFGRRGHHRRCPRNADGRGAVGPELRVTDRRTGAQQNGRVHARGHIEQQLQSDATTDRVSGVDERRSRLTAFGADSLDKIHHAGGQFGDRERFTHRRAVMPRQVPPHEVEILGKSFGDQRPQGPR